MDFIVCIPVLNAASRLPTLLSAIQHQSLQPKACWIIDSSSSDNSVAIAKQYGAKVHVIAKSDFNHGATRSLFLSLDTADIYLFLTDDAIPADTNAFSAMVKPFENPSVGFVYGRQLPHVGANLFATHLRLFNYPDQAEIKSLDQKERWGVKTAFCSDSFAAYRASCLREVDGFPSHVIVAEDVYVAAKMLLNGWLGCYAADAKVFHSHNYTVLQEFKRYVDIGVFYGSEAWIENSFGKTRGEGFKYLISEIKFIKKHGNFKNYFEWFFRNGLKWLGYKFGYYYKFLPRFIILKISMHRGFWLNKHHVFEK